MYLPHTSVFHNRVDNRHRDVEAELQKTKDSVNTLMKVVAFMAVLGVLIMCGVAGIVAQSMTNQRNSENKDDALALSLEHQHATLQEQQNNTEKQLEAFGDMMRTIESKLQASVEHQHMSDIDIRLKILNATDTIDAVQEQQNASDKALTDYRASTETRLETLNDTVQTVQEQQNASDKALTDYRASTETRLETLNDTVQTVHDTIDAVQEQQNASDKALTDYSTRIDRKLMEYNHTVQAVQEKQTVLGQQVAFSVYRFNMDLLPDGTPTFRYTVTNTGHYNMTSGRFTCPVAGLYYFSLTIEHGHIDRGTLYCRFQVNGSTSLYVTARKVPYEVTTGSVIQQLSVNDVGKLSCGGWEYVYHGSDNTVFSGFLISPD